MAPSGSTCTAVVILRRKNDSLAEFSVNASLVRRKKKGYLDLRRPKKCKKHFKKSLKNSGFIPAEACEGGRRD